MSAEVQPAEERRFEYFVVDEFDPEVISKRVEDLLNEGWKLQGNLVLAAYYNKDGENLADRQPNHLCTSPNQRKLSRDEASREA